MFSIQLIFKTASTDCFRFQTKPTSLKPVVVFIHGGAFMFGSSSVNSTGPDYFMQKDVVLVTLNFRQGVFGKRYPYYSI